MIDRMSNTTFIQVLEELFLFDPKIPDDGVVRSFVFFISDIFHLHPCNMARGFLRPAAYYPPEYGGTATIFLKTSAICSIFQSAGHFAC